LHGNKEGKKGFSLQEGTDEDREKQPIGIREGKKLHKARDTLAIPFKSETLKGPRRV